MNLIRNLNLFWGEEILTRGVWGVYLRIPYDFIKSYKDVRHPNYDIMEPNTINLYLSAHINTIEIPIDMSVNDLTYNSPHRGVFAVPAKTSYNSSTISITYTSTKNFKTSRIFNLWFNGIDECLLAKWDPGDSIALRGPKAFMGDMYIWLSDPTASKIIFGGYVDFIYPKSNAVIKSYTDESNDKVAHTISLNGNFGEYETDDILEQCEHYNNLMKNKIVERLSSLSVAFGTQI